MNDKDQQGSPVRLAVNEDSRSVPPSAVPGYLLVVLLLAAFAPALLEHAAESSRSWRFNDDVRQQIAPFLVCGDRPGRCSDYVSRYYLDALPLGYRAAYGLATRASVAVTTSKVLPYALLGFVVLAVYRASTALAGRCAAALAVAYVLSSDLFLSRMAGGLPRSFAFPVVALLAVSLVRGRIAWIAVSTVAAALFYPSFVVVCCLCLAAALFLSRGFNDPGMPAYSLLRSSGTLLLTVVLAGVAVAPTIVRMRVYGRTIPTTATGMFPELGPAGRYGPEDRAPFPAVVTAAKTSLTSIFRSNGIPFIPAAAKAIESRRRSMLAGGYILVLLAGCLALAVRDVRGRRFLLLPAMSLLAYVISVPVSPRLYLPQRHVAYSLPLFAALLVPAGAAGWEWLLDRLRPSRHWRPLVLISLGLIPLLVFGTRGSADAGLTVDARPAWKLYSFLRTLPVDAIVAGWPEGPIENVPYLSRRRAFLTFETHQAFHEGYALELRSRMTELAQAYWASEPAPLVDLWRTRGVTHLIVARNDYSARTNTYFEPFTAEIERLKSRAGAGSEISRQLGAAEIYRDAQFSVIDLRKVRSDPAARPDLSLTPPARPSASLPPAHLPSAP